MKEALFWTCLILGIACIAVQLIVYLIAAIQSLRAKPSTGGSGESLWDVPDKLGDLLKSLVDKAPLLVGGVLLLLVAAVFSGSVDASIKVQ